LISASLHAQTKQVGECALQFQITEQKANGVILPIGIKEVWVKGNQCKTTLTTAQLVQTFLFNTQLDKATITKDIGQSHFLQTINYPPVSKISLMAEDTIATDTATLVLGYRCKAMQLKWSDGSVYDILYTDSLNLTVNQFEQGFKNIPGLVLSYTITSAKGMRVQYQATKLDLSPLSLSLFTINSELYQAIDEK
jgi:hypothetical protein